MDTSKSAPQEDRDFSDFLINRDLISPASFQGPGSFEDSLKKIPGAPDSWTGFSQGISEIKTDEGLYVVSPVLETSNHSDDFVPKTLVNLVLITSDNPGGIPRPDSVNKDRRLDLRVEAMSLLLNKRIEALYPCSGYKEGFKNSEEVGVALRLSESFNLKDACALAHSYGQLAVYVFSTTHRLLVSCTREPVESSRSKISSVYQESIKPKESVSYAEKGKSWFWSGLLRRRQQITAQAN
jgi:hypothetical protein